MPETAELLQHPTALVVIDMQNDYVHREGAVIRYFREEHGSEAGGSGPTPAEQMVPTLRRLIAAAREAGVPVIWVVTEQKPWTETPYWQTRWREYEGKAPGWGRALYEGLDPRDDEPLIVKHRHSCFHATDIDLILRRLGVRTLIMTGVGTPYCVEGSVRDAHARDYHVITVSDATATRELEEHESALRRMGAVFGTVDSAAAIIDVWRQRANA